MDRDKQKAGTTRLAIAIVGSALILGGSAWIQHKYFPQSFPVKNASVNSPQDKAIQSELKESATGFLTSTTSRETVSKKEESPRIQISGKMLKGSIRLRGAEIDDLISLKYRETLDKNSPYVRLLSAEDSKTPTYVSIGWKQNLENQNVKIPTSETLWQADNTLLEAGGKPVDLSWNNGEGLTFKIKISLDEQYMFNVQQEIVNNSQKNITLQPYQMVHRNYLPANTGSMTEYLGPIGVSDGKLKDMSYKDIKKKSEASGNIAWSNSGAGGWGGIADKYWLVAAGVPQSQQMTLSYAHLPSVKENGDYQVSLAMPALVTPSNATSKIETYVYAGPKSSPILSHYEKSCGLKSFDSAIDFGWFSFLTRPILYLLHYLYGFIGNFGLALMALTVIVKIILFPLASKAAVSAARMKLLAPKMAEIKKQYQSDPKTMNQKVMGLYREEKVNPAAGCLPILIQAPIFFCLYKMLNMSFDERQAPFFGWIKDLSVPDPTNIFNLFGLLPFDPTVVSPFLHVSLWGLALGLTFWMMQRQTMVSLDPAQARIMQFMPLVYVFIMSDFPAGLLVYYTWNNVLTYLQQAYIQRRTVLPVPVKGGVIEGKK
ncbi:membrane protein insertase YidC [Acetobacteraceae bacterium]|nr:membrane protein insertase YidC [Acetobacteraceae bacterium]